jgi:hypothetical protein
MLNSGLFKAGSEAYVAWFLAADFQQNRQLQAFGYVFCFFTVVHWMCSGIVA